jgi:F0F1-type ATP synthase membrane subunit b/b'
MTARRPLLFLLIILPLFLAMSAEEGGHGSATMDFLGKLVNALVLFGGLTFVLRKPVKAMLIKRTADVDQSLRRAAAGRTEAQSKAESTKAKLAGLGAELEKLKAEAAEDSKRETERIARAAADEAARLKAFTRQELDEQLRRSVGEIKSYAAARAAAAARERIRRRLTPKVQSALIDKSIDRLSQLHEESRPR